MALEFNGVKMSDGTEYRVLLEFDEIVRTLDQAMKAGGLVTLPLGMNRPGSAHTINPQHAVSLTDYSGA